MIEPLARDHPVIAPDLLGHGDSEPGSGDYSIGALAAGLRDLLLTLGHDRGLDHPGQPRRACPRGHPRQPLHGLREHRNVPQVEAPNRFIFALEEFLAETEPAHFDADQWRARLGAAWPSRAG